MNAIVLEISLMKLGRMDSAFIRLSARYIVLLFCALELDSEEKRFESCEMGAQAGEGKNFV